MSTTDDIRSVLERIHQLQARLADLNGRLQKGPKVLKVQENNIKKQQDNLDKVRNDHQMLLADAKLKEQEVAANDLTISKRKQQLQEAKNNKDYSALQIQIKADEAARDVLEGEALEAIEKAEKFAETFPAVEEEVKRVQELYDRTKQKFLEEKPGIEDEIARFGKLLAEEEVKLPRDFKEIYLRLVQSKGGDQATAPVEKQKFCGGCNHQVPINSLAKILQKQPILCSSCARLLYVPEDFVFDKGR